MNHVFFYWLATVGTCATYQVVDPGCQVVALSNATTVTGVDNSSAVSVCWSRGAANFSIGCEDTPNSFRDVVMLQTTPGDALRAAELQTHWSADCSEAYLTVSTRADSDHFTLLVGAHSIFMRPGTREERTVGSNPSAWVMTGGSVPRPVDIPALAECRHENPFKWDASAYDEIVMVSAWAVIMLFYYAGIANGTWHNGNGMAELFHALVNSMHVAVLRVVVFSSFVTAAFAAIVIAYLAGAVILITKHRDLSDARKNGLRNVAVYTSIQTVILSTLILVDQ